MTNGKAPAFCGLPHSESEVYFESWTSIQSAIHNEESLETMARKLTGRICVTGTLHAIDALHVGSGEADHRSDMALAVDGDANLSVAGTGIAGALRAWCTRRFDESLVKAVFGYQKGDQGHAAFLFVENAAIKSATDQQLTADNCEIRDHVGIDDQYGTAAISIKFDRAVLPPGSKLKFNLTLELPVDGDALCDGPKAQAMLGHLLEALSSPDGIRIGGGKTRGLGRVHFAEDPVVHYESFGLKGLSDRLKNSGRTTRKICDLKKASLATTKKHIPRLQITIRWIPVLPTMSKSSTDGLLIDTLPLLGSTVGGVAPLLAGSGIKGVLRQRAELIIRTLLQSKSPAWMTSSGRQRFADQLDEDLPLIQGLFGSKSRKKSSKDSASVGALHVADCFATLANTLDNWNSLYLASATDGANEQQRMASVAAGKNTVGRGDIPTPRQPQPKWQVAYHNAIDRWTGGPKNNFLFQVLEPHGEGWNPFAMELDLDRIGKTYGDDTAADMADADATREQSMVLLLLVLRDLSKQRIPIGFGGNRGLGEIKVTSIMVKPIEGSPFGLSTAGAEFTDSQFSTFGEAIQTRWQASWRSLFPPRAQNNPVPPEVAHA